MSLPGEWKTIPRDPGYEASHRGLIRNARTRHVMSPGWDGRPASGFHVTLGGRKGKTYLVHRLVLEAHHGPCPEGMEACHDNGNARDNRYPENLRWDTHLANMADQRRHGTNTRTRRTHCPFDHLLKAPNLVVSELAAGGRKCRACNQARAWVQRHPEADLRAEADRRYELIAESQLSA